MGRPPRRHRSPGLWWRLRRASKIMVWCLVILVGGSMVAYFALAIR